MSRVLTCLIICLVVMSSPSPAVQGGLPDSTAAVLKITSEPAGLRVFDETSFLGTTPFESGPLPGGIFRFRIFGTDPGRWASPALFDSATLVAGDTVERHVVLPRYVHITSDPGGAEVRSGDSTLGVTPVFALLPRRGVMLTLSRPGFEDREILLPEGLGSWHAALTPADRGGAAGRESPLATSVGGASTPVVIAVSVAVVSGAASAYLKTKADTHYDEYRVTGDRGTLDRVRRYDLFSGIALGVTELSLGYLIMELLSH